MGTTNFNANAIPHSLTTLNPFPVPSLQTFASDLTVKQVGSDYYFKAQKGSDLLITGYDFPIGWTKGFPYKSAATIDIFGLTTVPVVSLFQNMEYGNQFFTKHVAQVVDENGVETSEAYVSAIVAYSAPLTGADLTTANTFFGVPTELTTGMKWVDGVNGLDTNDGSKATPYQTVPKAVSIISAGQTIYCKNGIIINGTGGTGYNILLQKACTIQGTGFTQFRGGGSTANALLRIDIATVTVKVNGIIFDGTGGYDTGILAEHSNKTFNRILIRNTDVYAGVLSGGAKIKDSVITSMFNRFLTGISYSDSCYYYTASLYAFITDHAAADLRMTNCKIQSRSGNTLWWYFNSLTAANFIGNIINIDHVVTPCFIPSVTAATFTFKYNKYNVSANLTAELLKQVSAGNTWVVEYNDIVITNALMANAAILLVNPGSLSIQGNKIVSESVNLTAAIQTRSSGTTCTSTVIKRNQIVMKSAAGYGICIGAEGTSAGDNKMTNIDISENSLKCAAYFDSLQIASMSIHAIFVGFNLNPIIRYNKIDGAGYGVVYKASGASDVSGVISYNISNNCLTGIRIKGVKATKIYNNTIVNSTAIQTSGIVISNNAGTNECEDFIIKNNIISAPLAKMLFEIVDKDGGSIDYNTYNSLSYQFIVAANTYTSLATYQAGESLDASSDNTNPALVNFIPTTQLTGIALDAAYDDGIDISSSFGSTTTLPAIVTKQQPATWQKGAFIQ
jgi:hypothetical protein